MVVTLKFAEAPPNDASPSVGAGMQYILKPAQGIVANLEFAAGKYGNNALPFKMGYAW